jgi:hypothetical protein
MMYPSGFAIYVFFLLLVWGLTNDGERLQGSYVPILCIFVSVMSNFRDLGRKDNS